MDKHNFSNLEKTDVLNFHQVFEDRLRIKKIVKNELGLDLDAIKENSSSPLFTIFEKYYKQEYDELNEKARQFKKSDFKENEAKIELQKQKIEYEKSSIENIPQINYEKIFSDYPELKRFCPSCLIRFLQKPVHLSHRTRYAPCDMLKVFESNTTTK